MERVSNRPHLARAVTGWLDLRGEVLSDHYKDASDLKKYRTEIPNMVFDLGLTPYEVALYGHLKRVCGAADGKCWKSVKTLSRETKMSTGRVSEARTVLKRRGLVKMTQPEGPGTSVIVTIVDIWPQNMARFMTPSDNEDPTDTPSSPEDQPSDTPSSDEPKNEPGMNELVKNGGDENSIYETAHLSPAARRRVEQLRSLGADV